MARRSEHSLTQIRKMVVERGQELIAEGGLSNFSARQVAKEVGYTPGMLYHLFGSYDQIVLNINGATLDDMYSHLKGGISRSSRGVRAIEKIAISYYDFARLNLNIWSALFEYHYPQASGLPQWYRDKIELLFGIVEAPVAALLPSRSSKARPVARTVWASVHGICILGLSGKLDSGGAESVKPLLVSLVRSYLFGVLHGK